MPAAGTSRLLGCLVISCQAPTGIMAEPNRLMQASVLVRGYFNFSWAKPDGWDFPFGSLCRGHRVSDKVQAELAVFLPAFIIPANRSNR